jgi:thioredoxin-like negative regulator of GroEL
MKPLVEGLEKTYSGKVEFRRLNLGGADQNANTLADSLGVQYVPTFVFVNSDGSIATNLVGEVTVDTLTANINTLK